MKYRKTLDRRTFLRGAGTVAIGLPFLEEMQVRSVYAGGDAPPVRAFNLFFGLGVPKEIQAEGLQTDALSPLAPFADKFAFLRGINLYEADGDANNHFDGGGAMFTAAEPNTESDAGGPSLDQVILNELYPEGPPTTINTLMMGSFFRRTLENNASLTRYVHCWKDDGTPVDVPIETPADLFTRVFGEGPPEGPGDLKAKHYDRSVLDSVLDQYQHYTSDAGGLGAGSQSRIRDHLDKVRELERKLFPEDLACEIPPAPGDMPLLHGQPVDNGGGGPELFVDEWVTWWRSLSDIYALAVLCDVTRFGMVMFQSGGERIRLNGSWDYNGETVNFDDVADSTGNGGSHEYWHSYQPGNSNTQMRWHTHFMMSQMAYFLSAIDDPNYAESNGQTVLENALITLGTELGDGNPHNLESVFHMVSQANGRILPGTYDVNRSGTDLYNTILQAHGVRRQMGTASAYSGPIDAILA